MFKINIGFAWIKKHINWIVGLIFGMVSMYVLGSIQNNCLTIVAWNSDKWGSIADWVGAIGTVCAFIVIIWQVKKQTDVERAIGIENCRPRFKIMYLPTISWTDIIIYYREDRKVVRNSYKHNVIGIKNLSDNIAYNSTFIFRSHTKNNSKIQTQTLTYEGFYPSKMIGILPSQFLADSEHIIYDSLTIKFMSKQNEIGFYEFINGTNSGEDNSLKLAGIYYVVGNNKSVNAYGDNERMIEKNTEKYNRLNESSDLQGTTESNFPQNFSNGK